MSSIQYYYDNLQFSSLLPNYINTDVISGNITLSGVIPDGSTVNFSTTLTLSSTTTFSDIYATGNLFLEKTQLVGNNSIDTIYSSVSTEFVQNSMTYSGNQVTIVITVNNFTGFPITLTTQSFAIEIVEYQIPF